jgi:hypothetical protein
MGGRCGSPENEGKIYGAFLIEDSVKWGETAICGLFKAEPLFQYWSVLKVAFYHPHSNT